MAEKAVPELAGLSVEFTCGGKTSKEKGRLVGAAALVVETPRREPLDTAAEVRFQPRPNSPLIEAKGFISAHDKNGVRVHFTEISDAHRKHLLELLFPPGSERRTSRRVSLATQMRTIVGGRQLVGYTRDISVGGAFVETELSPERGTEVTLRFKLTEDGPIHEARATVVYSIGGEGMGLRFWELAPSVREAIELFIGQK
ncbi:MAG: PilZ domain-containing protein [Candidatus Acidiferrales bacterium]